MKEINLDELKDLFYDTLENCNSSIYSKDDDEIEYEVLENFDIGVHSYMHDSNVEKLFNNKLINQKTLYLSKKLREKALALSEDEWETHAIKNSLKWKGDN